MKIRIHLFLRHLNTVQVIFVIFPYLNYYYPGARPTQLLSFILFCLRPHRVVSVEEMADILFPNVIAIQLWSPVQRSPLWLILEESHGVHILGGESVRETKIYITSN
jgi:hypothetical protein